MAMRTRDEFETWLQAYKAAWEGCNARAAASLFTPKVLSTTGRHSIPRSEGLMKLLRHGTAR